MLHSGSIRMEGMCFASKIRNFACNGWKTLTELSSFELLSIFDLASCFFFIPNPGCCIQTMFCVVWKQKTHLISFHTIFLFLKLHTKHQVCVFLIW